MQITSNQLRAARALLNWSREDLAEKADIALDSINKFENGHTAHLQAKTAAALAKIFTPLVEFMDNEGVRKRNDTLQVIEGADAYLKVLDDVFYTMHETGGEVLFAFVRNKLSPPEVIESDLRLRRLGLKFRSLIEEGDTYCLYPLREYRVVPKQFFHNNVQVIYGNKVASMLSSDNKAIIVNDAGFTEIQRKIFYLIWRSHDAPTKTTAPQTYE